MAPTRAEGYLRCLVICDYVAYVAIVVIRRRSATPIQVVCAYECRVQKLPLSPNAGMLTPRVPAPNARKNRHMNLPFLIGSPDRYTRRLGMNALNALIRSVSACEAVLNVAWGLSPFQKGNFTCVGLSIGGGPLKSWSCIHAAAKHLNFKWTSLCQR